MTDDPRDEQLARLIADAADDVQPTDHLTEIRLRTASARRRTRWYAAGGASLLAAAAVAAVALLGNPASPTADDPGPAQDPTPTVTDPAPTPSGSASPTTPPTGAGTVTSYTIFYAGDTPRGPRLYSEVRDVPGGRDLLTALRQLETPSLDPDYRALWPAGSFASAGFDGVGADGQLSVVLADASLRDRPAGMSAADAQLAVESVIWTLQAAASAGEPLKAPVQFYLDRNPIDQVFGVPTSEALAAGSSDDVQAQMNIAFPAEGAVVSGSFIALGRNNGFEATMTWSLTDAAGTVVLDGFATAEGSGEGGLFPWRTEPIDVSGLRPGTYTFTAANDDPSGGAEGSGPDTDTRSIIVE
ncbi:Gmad2 immunoglobulin-like domain-containing protein [Nocardioides sp.]|uniref:Gmad2 immunoglobulin-like domain-containing protein n=1 Tax=Nocardioides sp. TaxID=35761 RepID=UPI00286A55E6|nr:Gmad2 immunoglobulin-like domain-containing protein [Nocardioides sp.]